MKNDLVVDVIKIGACTMVKNKRVKLHGIGKVKINFTQIAVDWLEVVSNISADEINFRINFPVRTHITDIVIICFCRLLKRKFRLCFELLSFNDLISIG